MQNNINHRVDLIDRLKVKPSLKVNVLGNKSGTSFHIKFRKANKSIKKLSQMLISRVFANKSTQTNDTASNLNSLCSTLEKAVQKANIHPLNAIDEQKHELLFECRVLSNEFAYENFDWEKEEDDKILDSPAVIFESEFPELYRDF